MSEEAYLRSIAKVVVAQIISKHDFEGVQTSAVDILADLLVLYIKDMGRQAHVFAELCHRSDCNPVDVTEALERSGMAIKNLAAYVEKLDEEPFAQNIAQFPLKKERPSFERFEEEAPRHIPSFFPAFPDPHTRIESEVYPQEQIAQTEETRIVEQQKTLIQQQQAGEKALLSLETKTRPDVGLLRQEDRLEDQVEAAHPPPPPTAEKNAFFISPTALLDDIPPEIPDKIAHVVKDDRDMDEDVHVSTLVPSRKQEDGLEGDGGTSVAARKRRLVGGTEVNRARVMELLVTRREEEGPAAYVETHDHEEI